jgi:hypothetical protein
VLHDGYGGGDARRARLLRAGQGAARRERHTTLLFDTGLSPDVMVVNADRLGIDEVVVQPCRAFTGLNDARSAAVSGER